ncbi:major facilitator superfamily [Heterobasidion irregulare TC 32-1]|uniref:Major facilitator superfamily n=1 Tax=Heterobasidion irregulare (strain TC 32-1) TaxID=747525 RepID=W4KQP2_HETIT|nr:major facilitator superfamily [Heterobasidion irregulare TC 32-1]ETW87361.1 major facilitator superfamily [Heterobasidion irregulare TC 32-1]
MDYRDPPSHTSTVIEEEEPQYDPPSHTSTVLDAEPQYDEYNAEPKVKDKEVIDSSVIPAANKQDPFLVTMSTDDPQHPMNLSTWRKWYLTAVGGVLVLNATFASAAPSGVLGQMIEEFGMAVEIATLSISLFIAGYIVGPLFWGPVSEQIGRRPVFVVSFLFYTGFQVGCALSHNTGSILVFRFLSGCFAAAPLTNSGGVVSDIWDAKTRGRAMVLFAVAPFAGPALGPVVSGWIEVGGASWRWLFWVLTIFAGLCLVAIVFTVPETYVPILTVRKAEHIRKVTGDERYYAPLETKISISKQVENILAKPFKILFREPMLLAITIYMSFLYGCLYLLFEAFPIVFTEGHHMNQGVTGLMYLPISIGGFLGVVVYLAVFDPRYNRALERYAPNPVPPEHRLEMPMLGAPIFAIAFFWFGWTSYPSISYWSPLIAGGVMGFGIFGIFLSLFNYIIDTYLMIAASALAASTVVRSIFGAVFPLFARQMFDALNPRWASTLLGCIALLMCPIPFVLRKYGPTLRAKSKYAPDVNVPRPSPV